jgi:hypothetical protein
VRITRRARREHAPHYRAGIARRRFGRWSIFNAIEFVVFRPAEFVVPVHEIR